MMQLRRADFFNHASLVGGIIGLINNHRNAKIKKPRFSFSFIYKFLGSGRIITLEKKDNGTH